MDFVVQVHANLIVYGFHNFPPVYNALIRGFRGTVVRAINYGYRASAFRLGDCGFHSRYTYMDSCEKSQSMLCQKARVFAGVTGLSPPQEIRPPLKRVP